MMQAFERVLDQYERGVLNRRQLLGALAMLAVPSAAPAQSPTPGGAAAMAVSPALTINHVHLDVSNVERSIKFYSDVLGAVVRDTSPGNATITLPGRPTWISLTQTKEKPHYNHAGYGVKFDTAKRIAADINKMYPSSKARETGPTVNGPNTRSVYLYDPDGIYFQIVPIDDDGWLPTGPVGSKILKGERG